MEHPYTLDNQHINPIESTVPPVLLSQKKQIKTAVSPVKGKDDKKGWPRKVDHPKKTIIMNKLFSVFSVFCLSAFLAWLPAADAVLLRDVRADRSFCGVSWHFPSSSDAPYPG